MTISRKIISARPYDTVMKFSETLITNTRLRPEWMQGLQVSRRECMVQTVTS